MQSLRLSSAASVAFLFCLSSCGSGERARDAEIDAQVSLDAATTVDASDAAIDASDAAIPMDASDAAVPMDAYVEPTVPCVVASGIVTLTNGAVRVEYDMTTGTASFFHDGTRHVANFYAGVQLANYTTSKMYTSRTCTTTGAETTVTNSANGLPTMRQTFLLDGGNKFLTRVTIEGNALSTRWIAPVVMDTVGGVDVGSYGDPRLLWVPFDNDAWVSFNALPINNSGTSFEAAAFYDNVNRHGIVVGSVTHDTWKTGVYYSGSNNRIDALNVFGGATHGTWTHDPVAHGLVQGNVIASPLVFVGYDDDYRDLLEEFAAANAVRSPKLAWASGVPFGWNSWGKVQTSLSYAIATGVSDYIHASLSTNDFNGGNGAVYVNLDSYWDNLSDEQLGNFVDHCEANGQKAGIYWAPFVDWGKSASRTVEGTAYTYGEIWLRNDAGDPIELDGAYAIDPSHPGTLARIDHFIDRFKSHGFAYLKLDFLTHGALESTVRHDANVQTGIQAYNMGMRHIVERIAGTMFISESIAPLFPNGYAHARRVACDTYGEAVGLTSTHYLMNSVTYGWWMSGSLYAFNDPDHMVFDGFDANDNMARVISGVISGTVFLSGDDLTQANGRSRASTYLTNPRLNAVARLGRTFRPLEGNTGTNPSDVFVLHHGGAHYVAVFNFGGSSTTRVIDLARAGLNNGTTYTVTDLWTNGTSSAQGTLSVSLGSHYAKLFRLE